MPAPKVNQSFPVGSQVVMNDLPDATVFEVVETDNNFMRKVREAGRPPFASQRIDVCLCRTPTAEQIKNHFDNVRATVTERELNYWHGV